MSQPAIEFRGVSKQFSRQGQQVNALEDISLTINQGDIFGVIGYSGAGKSTLLRLINRLEVPTQGTVTLAGETLNDVSPRRLNALKKNIGMIFQHFNLLNSRTVFHNVAIPLILQGLPKAQIRQRVEELLTFVDLIDKQHSYPDELSGGQKQRVGIARALATNPAVLLCDEATSALDPHTTVQILLLLQEINRRYGITIVLITHEMSVIQKICHRVAVFEQGRMVEEGSVLQLFSAPQHPVTARFVSAVIHDQLPEAVTQFLAAAPPGAALRLEFIGESARQPLIQQVMQAHGIEVNILFASMTEVQQTILGFMIITLNGEAAAIQAARHTLHQAGVRISDV
ncbi:methionine ABC transporter ATP-binding protein [Pantoea sp. A4]|uniref:methionine ABC transporter ATP-binding protein n=1 Tax=Pantoea sp. A4 TaxID=1225184 RepID=UPI00036581B6|nr:ATP-binding cassette domain-containing protein [Pantoea sp. A4]